LNSSRLVQFEPQAFRLLPVFCVAESSRSAVDGSKPKGCGLLLRLARAEGSRAIVLADPRRRQAGYCFLTRAEGWRDNAASCPCRRLAGYCGTGPRRRQAGNLASSRNAVAEWQALSTHRDRCGIWSDGEGPNAAKCRGAKRRGFNGPPTYFLPTSAVGHGKSGGWIGTERIAVLR